MNTLLDRPGATAPHPEPVFEPVFDPVSKPVSDPAGAPASTPGTAPGRRALRLLTAGSVDDGKSTLIGRLLYDSRAILADQLHNLQARAAGQAAPLGGPDFDLSLLTDGLEAEREQGITIDVAYRYFATPARKFIIADAPGHEQYTRNMVTAAAGSDAAVVLVDVSKLRLGPGPADLPELLPQTRRHALLAQLLRVPHIVFAVNKIDAVADPGAAFAATRRALLAFAEAAGFSPAAVVPVSALRGDNLTTPLRTPWYAGPSLLQVLEGLAGDEADSPGQQQLPLLLPVQYVARQGVPGSADPQRVFWGRIAQGRVAVGDELQVFPGGQHARVVGLQHAGQAVQQGVAGQSAGLVLDRALDVSRGDWFSAPGALVPVQRFTATLAWLDTEAATPGRRYWLRHGHRWVQGRITALHHRLDIHSLQPLPAQTLAVNEIGHVTVELQQPLPLQPYAGSRDGGALIVVDPSSHRSSGALLVQAALEQP
jgi:sulfate adenylyltransferase subunit 1